MNNREVLDQLERGYRHPRPKDCDQNLYEVMLTCWDQNAQNRPTFEYLHSFLDDFYASTEGKYDQSDGV